METTAASQRQERFRRWGRHGWAAATVAVAIVSSKSARADQGEVCKDAYEQSQPLMKAGSAASRLLDARSQLRVCLQSGCKAWMVADCTKWLADVEQRIPTVVFSATETGGADLYDVVVAAAGKPILSRLDGRAVELEPGESLFSFTLPDGRRQEKLALVKEGQKAQKIAVTFVKPPAPAAEPSSGSDPMAPAPPTSPTIPAGESSPNVPAARSPSKPRAASRAKGPARIRLRATCGGAPKLLMPADGLVLQDVVNTTRVPLSPVSAPEFVEYELPAGPHRIRIKATGCTASEDRVTLESGVIFEQGTQLVPLSAIPVRFARPPFLEKDEDVELVGAEGSVCTSLPCTTPVLPVGQRLWVRVRRSDGELTEIPVPDPGDDVDDAPLSATVIRSRKLSIPGAVAVGVGSAAFTVAFWYFYFDVLLDNHYRNFDHFDDFVKTDKFTALAVTAGAGLGVTLAGAIMIAAHVGSAERLSVVFGAGDGAKSAGRIELRPALNGLQATF
jgi:hypothetical protein